MTTPAREKYVEILWKGNATTEAALLRALGWDYKDVPEGNRERWIRIPARQEAASRKALEDSGARMHASPE